MKRLSDDDSLDDVFIKGAFDKPRREIMIPAARFHRAVAGPTSSASELESLREEIRKIAAQAENLREVVSNRSIEAQAFQKIEDRLASLEARIDQAAVPAMERPVARFSFRGHEYLIGPQDLAMISLAVNQAIIAFSKHGGDVHDFRWAGPYTFGWTTVDDKFVPMDAPTVVAFGKEALAQAMPSQKGADDDE